MNRIHGRGTRALILVFVAACALVIEQGAALAYDIYADAHWSTWSPYQGSVEVTDVGNGHAWSYQDLYWSSAYRHSTLTYEWNGTSGYEHEIIFYNYDGNGYSNGATTHNSNLPSTNYLDPGFLPPSQDELTIEIGTTRADTLSWN